MKHRTTYLLACGASFLLLLSLFLNISNLNEIREAEAHADEIDETIDTIWGIYSSLKDAQTAQRNYIITGEEQHLGPYYRSIASMQVETQAAVDRLGESNRLTSFILLVSEAIDTKKDFLESAIQTRRDQGLNPAIKLVRTEEGDVALTQVATTVEQSITRLRTDLGAQIHIANEAHNAAVSSCLYAGVPALLSIVALILNLNRVLRDRERQKAHLDSANGIIQGTLSSISEGVISITLDQKVSSINPAAAKMLVKNAADCLDKPLEDVLRLTTERQREELERALQKNTHHSETGRDEGFAGEILRQGAEPLPISLRTAPLRTEAEKTNGTVLTLIDISERIERERSIRESETRFRSAFENAAVGIAHTSATGNLIRVNQRLCEMLGRTEEELVNLNFREITHSDDKAKSTDQLNSVLQGRVAYQKFVKRYLHKSGETIWANVSFSLVRDEEGNPDYFVSVIEEITERVLAQEALQEREALLRQVLDNLNAFVAVLSPDTNLVEINENALRQGQLKREDCIGQPLLGLVWWSQDPSTSERLQEACDEAIKGVASRFDGKVLDHSSETGFIEADISVIPFRDDKGNLDGIVVIANDVTERKHLESQLREFASELSLANSRKDEFLATLAHELRNPMAPIRTGLEILRLSPDDPITINETREMMERQTKQLATLVDDLIDVSRVTRGKMELRLETIDLKDIIEVALETSQPLIDGANHTLKLSVGDEDMMVNADPGRISQVLTNLLNNAAKYSPDGGNLELSAKVDKDIVFVQVRDSGIGISADMQEFVFELFAQIKEKENYTTSGLGIGLTLAKSIVEQHDGNLSVFSEGSGKGTTFTLALPLHNHLDSDTDAALAETQSEPGQKTVLIADDNPAIVRTVALMMKLKGHNVITAKDGKEAYQMARQHNPHIAFMDIGMPEMNGFEAADKIRSQPWGSSIMLVALTGWNSPETVTKAMDNGFDHHLVKPPEPEQMEKLIANSVRLPRRPQ